MNPSLHISTVSWLLNQNIFSPCYHILYQVSCGIGDLNSLLKVKQGIGDRELHRFHRPGALRNSAWTGTYLHFKAFSKDLFTLQSKWNSFQNLPNETGLSELVPRIFQFWAIPFFFFLFWEIIFHTCFPSLSPPPHIFCFCFFSVYIWKISHLKSILSLLLGMGSGLASLALPSALSVETLALLT